MTRTNPTQPTHADEGSVVDSAIRMRDVTVVRSGQVALTVDALEIGPGVTALVGPNGSGKSTLLHVIAGLLTASSGSVDIGCHHETVRHVAYVLQTQPATAHLLVTVREVVSLARAADRGPFRRLRVDDRAIVDAAMARLEVADLAGRHVAELSGGQRQRVFAAQGLAQDAEILLLDEPTAGLDLASSDTIRRVIEGERQAGRTIVVATHDLEEASRADRVVLLDRRVVASGPPADVLTAANLRIVYGGRILDLGDGYAIDDGAHHDHGHTHDGHDHPRQMSDGVEVDHRDH